MVFEAEPAPGAALAGCPRVGAGFRCKKHSRKVVSVSSQKKATENLLTYALTKRKPSYGMLLKIFSKIARNFRVCWASAIRHSMTHTDRRPHSSERQTRCRLGVRDGSGLRGWLNHRFVHGRRELAAPDIRSGTPNLFEGKLGGVFGALCESRVRAYSWKIFIQTSNHFRSDDRGSPR